MANAKKSKPTVPVNKEVKVAPPKFYCMGDEPAQTFDRILSINEQARQIGTLDYKKAYENVITFIAGNLKEKV